MADTQALKDQLDEMGAALAADPNTPASVLRFLYMWKAHEAAEALERAASVELRETSRPTSVPRPKAERVISSGEANRDRIIDAVRDVLVTLNEPHPVKTAEVFALLPPEIVSVIPGKEPRYNLSAIMHNSGQFRSHGRDGWMLPDVKDASEVTSENNGQEALGIH